MTSVPQQHDLKWPRLEPTPHDFAEAMKLGGRSRLAEDTKKGSVFTVSSKFVLPKSLKFTVANLKQIDRSAGTAANQRAAAATAWILANAGNDFAHAPMTWTGQDYHTGQSNMYLFNDNSVDPNRPNKNSQSECQISRDIQLLITTTMTMGLISTGNCIMIIWMWELFMGIT